MKLAWINEKGGTLKTTLATHSAVYLAAFRGEKTLLIDVDPQGQAGKCLGLRAVSDPGAGLSSWLDGSASLSEVSYDVGIPNLKVIPSDKSLVDTAEQLQIGSKGQGWPLAQRMATVRGYTNIVIDSPPSLGWLTRNILASVHEVMIPINLSYLALDGAAQMVQTVEQAQTMLPNKKLRVGKVVPTLYRRTRLADSILEKLEGHFGARCATTRLPVNVKIDEAQSWGKNIWSYAPRSTGAVQMLRLMEELFGPPVNDGIASLKNG